MENTEKVKRNLFEDIVKTYPIWVRKQTSSFRNTERLKQDEPKKIHTQIHKLAQFKDLKGILKAAK